MKHMLRTLARLFSSMPRREKISVVLLTVILAISLIQYFFLRGRISIDEEKGMFTEGMIGDIRLLNPVFADFNDADRDLSELIFSGLIRFDPAQKNFFPDLAESFERSKNGLTYTFKLRENALWHDGAKVSADDILFTFNEVIQNPEAANYLLRESFAGVAIQKIDDRTVSFTLTKPNSYFISNLTVGILPAHILRQEIEEGLNRSSFNTKPIGSGPFRVVNANIGSQNDLIELEAFSNYYGTKPLISRMRIAAFSDEESLLSAVRALQSVAKVPLKSSLDNALREDKKFVHYPYSLNQFTALYFNTNHTLLQNKDVRRALGKALDKDALVLAGEKRIDSLDLETHSSEAAFAFDRAAAEKKLDELGLKKAADGMRRTNKDEKIILTLLTLEKTPEELTERLKEQLAGAGIAIEVQREPADSFAAKANERRFDLLLIKQNLGYNRDVYPIFHSSQALGQPGTSTEPVNAVAGLNFSNFKSFRTDGLTEAIRKESNPPDKEKLLIELSKVISEEAPVIFLSTTVYSYALEASVEAFPVSSMDFHADRMSIIPYLHFSN